MMNARTSPRSRLVWCLLLCLCLVTAGCAASIDFIDFATFTRAPTPNNALACPAGLCREKADFVTEPVAMPADALAVHVVEVLSREVRTDLVARDGLRLVFVQRSRIFRFPDTVNIAVIPLDATHASLAMYSQSNYGHGDFGVNLARVTDWLAKLGVTVAGG